MKASQYKAIRDTGVDEFAIYPADVEASLPWGIEHANKTGSIRSCPTGLLHATIIKDNVAWHEGFTLGCGDTQYQRERRNGVLVEISLENLRRQFKKPPTIKALGERVRTEIVRHADDTRHVQMIVSKLSIMAPWNEYALVEAEREKIAQEAGERNERMSVAVEGVGAKSGSFKEDSGKWDSKEGGYLPPETFDYSVRSDRREDGIVYLQGEVVLSLARAEEIAAKLAQPLGVAAGVKP